MLSCWHDLLFFLSLTVLSFSSFHGLVVWGWGLWTDSVLTLSRPCTEDSKIIIGRTNYYVLHCTVGICIVLVGPTNYVLHCTIGICIVLVEPTNYDIQCIL